MGFKTKLKGHTRFSFEALEDIRSRGREGQSAKQVADWYNCAPETIRKIWRGETFRNVGAGGVVEEKEPWTEEMAEKDLPMVQRLFAEAEVVKSKLPSANDLLAGMVKGKSGHEQMKEALKHEGDDREPDLPPSMYD